MRRKQLILLLLLQTVSLCGFAQGVKSVNAIKRSSQYLYAEATMDSVSDAYDVAKELLVGNIKVFASGKKAYRDKDILVKDISSRCDSIQLRRGEMYKVFLYVKKDDILGVSDNLTLIGERPVAPAVVQEEAETTVFEAERPPVAAESGDVSLRLPLQWQQDVIERLLAATSYEQAKALISRFRAETKIKRAGPETTCRDRSACFWLVGQAGKVVTVLGPGSGERTDFRSLTKTELTQYSGLDLYWFSLAK